MASKAISRDAVTDMWVRLLFLTIPQIIQVKE